MQTTEKRLSESREQFKTQFEAIKDLSQQINVLGAIVQNCPPTVDDLPDFINRIGQLDTTSLQPQTEQLTQALNDWTKATKSVVDDFNQLMTDVATEQHLV